MHLPVIGHGAVDIQPVQQTDDVICLLDGLLHGDSLGEEVHAGLQPRPHSAPDVLLVVFVGVQAAGAGAPEAHPDHGEVDVVIRHGVPVDLPLEGGNVNAVPGAELAAQIFQPPLVFIFFIRPNEIHVGEHVQRTVPVNGHGLAAVFKGAVQRGTGLVDLGGLGSRALRRDLRCFKAHLTGAVIADIALDHAVHQGHVLRNAGS